MKISPPVLEKKIFKGFYHIWKWRPSCSCDLDAQGGSIENLALIGHAVSEEKTFEIVDGRMDDGGTPDHGYPISSPVSLRLR